MTKKEDVVAPIVHLNGTHANELIELRWDVVNALEEAIEALKRACPNERDYYPVEGLYGKAMSQYALRKAMLETIIDGLHEEISRIGRQTTSSAAAEETVEDYDGDWPPGAPVYR